MLDLETTGGSPSDDAICEIGAVKVRGGEVLGTFHTFVDPGRDLPPEITVLTGLTSATVRRAPPIDAVLDPLLDFLGDAVFVAHNVRFDRSFLDAALVGAGHQPLTNVGVDTVALARRLLGDEVRDHRLGTLARSLRLPHQPTHRALDDAWATVDLLHVLIERSAGLGVRTIDDLVELPTALGHPQSRKLSLTDDLPRAPGVYLFRDVAGRVLYVGKASDLRGRVRSYFSSDRRRKVDALLRETATIDHETATSSLEASVREMRLIHHHLPRFNAVGTGFARSVYVTLTDEEFPRLSIVRRPRGDRTTLGPVSRRMAQGVVDAVGDAVPLRRCTADPRKAPRAEPCTPAQLGIGACPCAGAIDASCYSRIVADATEALVGDPAPVVARLEDRIAAHARAERFEDAAVLRDRLAAYLDARRRQRRMATMRRSGVVVLRVGGHRAVLDHGRLHAVAPLDGSLLDAALRADAEALRARDPGADGPSSPVAVDDADELLVVGQWLDRNAHRIELESVSGVLASTLPELRSGLDPRPRRGLRRGG